MTPYRCVRVCACVRSGIPALPCAIPALLLSLRHASIDCGIKYPRRPTILFHSLPCAGHSASDHNSHASGYTRGKRVVSSGEHMPRNSRSVGMSFRIATLESSIGRLDCRSCGLRRISAGQCCDVLLSANFSCPVLVAVRLLSIHAQRAEARYHKPAGNRNYHSQRHSKCYVSERQRGCVRFRHHQHRLESQRSTAGTFRLGQ